MRNIKALLKTLNEYLLGHDNCMYLIPFVKYVPNISIIITSVAEKPFTFLVVINLKHLYGL